MLSSASNEYVAEVLNGRCDQGRLVDALRTLLGFYYQPNETPEERARHIALFVADLSDMSDDCVWWALREWRRNHDRRPTPAALRQLCMVRRTEASRRQFSPAKVETREPPSEEEKARIRALLEQVGFTPKRMQDEIINSSPEPF